MEGPINQNDRSIEVATKWNRQLADRVARWKRLRFSLAVLFTSGGIAAVFSGSASIWSVPCFIVAFMAYLLYLDARDQLREIRARKWKSITPRIRPVGPQDHEGTAETTPSS